MIDHASQPQWARDLRSALERVDSPGHHQDRVSEHHEPTEDSCQDGHLVVGLHGARLQAHRLVDVVADLLFKCHRCLRDRVTARPSSSETIVPAECEHEAAGGWSEFCAACLNRYQPETTAP